MRRQVYLATLAEGLRMPMPTENIYSVLIISGTMGQTVTPMIVVCSTVQTVPGRCLTPGICREGDPMNSCEVANDSSINLDEIEARLARRFARSG